jgi:hypothetical protein
MIKKFALLMLSASCFLQADDSTYDYNEHGSYGSPQEIYYEQPYFSCCEQGWGHFKVCAEALYWRPYISGLELSFGRGTLDVSNVGGIDYFISNELDIDPHFDWDWGYRIGGIYQFDCSPLEIGVLWTHFDGQGERRESGNFGKVKVKLNQLDLVFAYNKQDGCSSFSLKPFIGVRAARIKENIDAFVITYITLPAPATELRTFDDNQKYRGIGPLLGVQGEWDLGCGFGLYGNAAGSLLYGLYRFQFNGTDIFSAPISDSFIGFNKRRVHGFDWNVDLALGFYWNTCLCDDVSLNLKLGFEHHQFFNHNRVSVYRGDLCFDGAVFAVGLSF